jgi:diacylglycerol kinase family enzyme
MRQRAVVLLNRSSRGGDEAAVARIAELLRGGPLDGSPLEAVPGHRLAAAAAQAVASGCSLLIAAGGDGTVSTVASVAASHGVVLGVLALGTLNHFARDAGIPPDLEAAVAILTRGQVATIDVGEVNGRVFVNNSSIGVYPRLIWERQQQQQQGRPKWTAFALAGLRIWREYRRITVTIEGRGYRRNVRTPFVFVGNNEYAIEGGRIDARSSLDRGRLQLCMAPGADRGRMALIVFAAIAGRLGMVEGFESVPATELTIAASSRRMGVSLDGELMILAPPLRYRIRPRALRVMVPTTEATR